MTLRLNGSTSGYTELDAPAVAGNNLITLPTSNGSAGQLLKNGTTAGALGWSSLVEDSSGRVLVGTSSSASAGDAQYARLQVQGNTTASTAGAIFALMRQQAATAPLNNGDLLGKIDFTDSAGNAFGTIFCQADAASGANDYPGRLIFSTCADAASSPTERMRIASYGRVIIGHNGGSGGVQVDDGSIYSLLLRDRITFNASPFYIVNQSTVGVYLGNGSTSWAAQSDERLKTALAPIENGLDKIASLRAVTGRYTSDKEDARRSFLIAQDVQAVLPEAVDVGNDDDQMLSLRYTEVIPLLVAALKESKERIEGLEAAVTALQQS